ncbi:tetratricopeptide repeat protein [Candidatus Margulisiibacteriota bacterium]
MKLKHIHYRKMLISIIIIICLFSLAQPGYSARNSKDRFLQNPWLKKALMVQHGGNKYYYFAHKLYDKAIKNEPDNYHAYRYQGTLYGIQKEWDKALERLNKALELNPELAMAYIARAVAFLEKEEYQKALDDAENAVELMPELPLSYIVRGGVYLKMKDFEAASRDIDTAMQINEKYGDGVIYAALAELYAVQNDSEAFYYNMEIALKAGYKLWDDLEEENFAQYVSEPRFISMIEKYAPADVSVNAILEEIEEKSEDKSKAEVTGRQKD